MKIRKSVQTIALSLALGVASSACAAETITLKVADNLPSTHFIATYATKYFMEEVSKATNGEVKFQYYPSEQLGKARDMLSLTQKGVADIGLVVPSYIGDKMPLTAAIEIPGDFATSCEGTKAYWQLAKNGGFLDKHEFAPNGVRVLFVYVNPAYQILMKSPIERLADLKGKKIRVAGSAQFLMMKQLGAVPVRTSAPEVHQALSRGTVDGVNFPIPTVFSYDLQNMITAATRGGKFGTAAVTYVMSRDRWDKLPEDVKKAIEDVGERTTNRVCGLTDADVEKGYQALASGGVKLISLDAADQKAFAQVAAMVEKDWVDQIEKSGKPARETREAWLQALKNTSNK